MNLRDREFPDRRALGAKWRRAPVERRRPSLIQLTPYTANRNRGSLATVTTSQATAVSPMQILRGQAVSPGIAIGPVVVLDPRGLRLPPRSIAAETIGAELERLDRGLEAAHRAAGQDEGEARARLGPQYADILAAHCRMISDPTVARRRAQDH